MEYTDGFFDVSSKNGFLPIHDPLVSLPLTYLHLQTLISDLPIIIKNPNEIVERVKQIPDYSKDIENEKDVFIIQALFRAYTFITSSYTLEASYQEFVVSGTYGKARRVLPSNISKPLVLVSEKLGVYPWLDYHYAYSLGNYVRKDRSDGLDWKNLEMACSFTDSPDEVGFIMLHVYINELSPALVECVMKYKESGIRDGHLQQKDSRYLKTCAQVMKQIVEERCGRLLDTKNIMILGYLLWELKEIRNCLEMDWFMKAVLTMFHNSLEDRRVRKIILFR